MSKIRADVYLAENGFAQSREKARAMINDGIIYINGKKCEKPGQQADFENARIELRGETLRYVSRGGLKLEKAIAEFGIDLKDRVAMDIGASTGGFTDCMLQNGAKKVYAVDVGSGQLAQKLLDDARVVNMEHTNIRALTPDMIGDKIEFASIDVSFISLSLVFPTVKMLLKDNAEAVALIKPQFEAGRENVGKKGVVRDKKVHIGVIEKTIGYARENGLCPIKLSFSPIKGPEGNIEYLLYMKNNRDDGDIGRNEIETVVDMSHADL